jgi:hypothetical protein
VPENHQICETEKGGIVMSSCSATTEKKFGVKVCRERGCKDLQKDPKWPDSPQQCQVTHGMPGAMSCCVKEMDAERFIRHISGQLNNSPYGAQRPGVRNCPKECPYKIFIEGEKFVFEKGKPESSRVPAKIGTCALIGKSLGECGVCPCNVLGNKFQESQILQIKGAIERCQKVSRDAFESGHACSGNSCPDGIQRCDIGDKPVCPLIRVPFADLKECPLWRIPAKTLPATAAAEPVKKSQKSTEKVLKKSSGKLVRKDKPEPPAPNTLYLEDNKDLTARMAPESVDLIFTDPTYLKDPVIDGIEQWERAYVALNRIAGKVLKPSGFLFTYAPQAHLLDIMEILAYGSSDQIMCPTKGCALDFFWIIPSLNLSQSTAKNHKHNAICLHKPILVYQKPPFKSPSKCFADVVRGKRQKAYHPFQQSIHDVLGIISRFMEPGQVLYDPYTGTGTSLKAAKLLGLQWIGCEIDPKTHAIAVRELQQEPITLFSFDEGDDIGPCRTCSIECPDDNEGCKEFQEFAEKEIAAGPGPQDLVDSALFTKENDTSIDKKHKSTWMGKSRAQQLKETAERDAALAAGACHDCEASDRCKKHDPHAGCLNEIPKPRTPKGKHRRPALNKCPETCPYRKIIPEDHGREKRYPQGRCGAALGQTLREMEACPHGILDEMDERTQGYLIERLILYKEGQQRERLARIPAGADPTKVIVIEHPSGAPGSPGPICKTCGWPEAPQEGSCLTCGHHKARKTFHETCPRLPDLMFKGGTYSAEQLMKETLLQGCYHWMVKEKAPVKKMKKPKEPETNDPLKLFLNEHFEQIITGKDVPIVPGVMHLYDEEQKPGLRSLKLYLLASISDEIDKIEDTIQIWSLPPSGKIRKVAKTTGRLYRGYANPDCKFTFQWHFANEKKEE